MDIDTIYGYDLTDKSCLTGALDSCELHISSPEEQSSHASAVASNDAALYVSPSKNTNEAVKSGAIERKWTDEELELLRHYYPTESSTIHLRIPRHTLGSCQRKASLMGIRSLSTESWSAEEDAVLKEYYPSEGNRVSERLPGRSRKACIVRAGALGIKSQTRVV